MKISRGLIALILSFLFQNTLVAQYLYKDEVTNNHEFKADIEKLGHELYQKTGISLQLIMLHELPHGANIVEYEKNILLDAKEPTVLLTFAELDMKVDIASNDSSLYKLFDRKQVLSPVSSPVQAFLMALIYSNSFESFKEISTSYGGTILPLLAQKAKDGEQIGKYSGSMFNGYADIAEQIADSKGIVLENAVGNANQNSILVVKIIFYGFLLYGIYLFVKRKIYLRREKNETK